MIGLHTNYELTNARILSHYIARILHLDSVFLEVQDALPVDTTSENDFSFISL